jgi:hypothetical protein
MNLLEMKDNCFSITQEKIDVLNNEINKRVVNFDYIRCVMTINCFDEWTDKTYNEVYNEILKWELKI